jgi:hypothetical protein
MDLVKTMSINRYVAIDFSDLHKLSMVEIPWVTDASLRSA